jgi:hypothetical protein
MDNNLNATCSICGERYRLCLSCQDSKLNPWRSIVDSIEHYKIFIIIRDYENGYISKEEANEQLIQRDLTGSENFVPEIKAKIEEIMAVANKVNKSKSKKNLNSIDISDESSL